MAGQRYRFALGLVFGSVVPVALSIMLVWTVLGIAPGGFGAGAAARSAGSWPIIAPYVVGWIRSYVGLVGAAAALLVIKARASPASQSLLVLAGGRRRGGRDRGADLVQPSARARLAPRRLPAPRERPGARCGPTRTPDSATDSDDRRGRVGRGRPPRAPCRPRSRQSSSGLGVAAWVGGFRWWAAAARAGRRARRPGRRELRQRLLRRRPRHRRRPGRPPPAGRLAGSPSRGPC